MTQKLQVPLERLELQLPGLPQTAQSRPVAASYPSNLNLHDIHLSASNNIKVGAQLQEQLPSYLNYEE